MSLLGNHIWAMENVFSTKILMDEYLALSTKQTRYLRTDVCVKDEVEMQRTLQRLKALNVLCPGEEKAVNTLLACTAFKISVLKLHWNRQPIILDLERYLNASLLSLNSFQELQIRHASSENYSSFMQNIESRITEKKAEMHEAISAYLAEINKWFADLQQQAKDDLSSIIRVVNIREKFDWVIDTFKGIAGLSELVGSTILLGTGYSGPVLGASATLSWLLARLPEKDKLPSNFKSTPNVDLIRVKQETAKRVNRYIETIQRAIHETPGLRSTFFKCLEDLGKLSNDLDDCRDDNGRLKEDLFRECLMKTEKSRQNIFTALKTRRDLIKTDTHPLAKALDCLYFDLIADESSSELYKKVNSSLVKTAREWKENAEDRFIPVMDRLLKKVGAEIGSDMPLGVSKWKLKDLIMEMKEYLVKFVKELPCKQQLEMVFKKVDLALEMHINLWDSVDKEMEKKEMATFIAKASGGVDEFNDVEIDEELKRKVIHIQFLTRACLLLLEYEKIERGFLQWAFPYGKRYMETVMGQVAEIRAVCSGNSEVAENEIRSSSQTCKEIVRHFLEVYSKSQSETMPEDAVWCTHYFSGLPGSAAFYQWSCEDSAELIRKLLLGQSTTFLADVRKSPEGKGAIKINNTIDLRFICAAGVPTEFQDELDKIIGNNFLLEMTHSGDSYYRVNSEYFVIRGEPMSFLGDIETAAVGDPQNVKVKKTENDSRAKLKDYVLSPYTEWTFKLRLANPDNHEDKQLIFGDLADKFAHCVNLNLVGLGRYLDESGGSWKDMQPLDMDVFYEKDDFNVDCKTEELYGGKAPSRNRNYLSVNNIPYDAAARKCLPILDGQRKIGLKNLGNTCYMNSVVQCLAHTSRFADYLRAHRNDRTGIMVSVFQSLAMAINELEVGGTPMYSLMELKKNMGKWNSNFLGKEQADAHEFLMVLLDRLDLEMKSNPVNYQSPDIPEEDMMVPSPNITDLFGGQQKSVVRCQTCDEVSETWEPFLMISLPIPSGSDTLSLQDCLDCYTASEIIEGWRCPNCKKDVEAMKRMCLCKLPQYLIIHLKRFHYDGSCKKKLLTDVNFPLNDLKLVTPSSSESKEHVKNENNYQLYAVSNHYGGTDVGHYVSFCRDKQTGAWWKLDDEIATSYDARNIVSPAAYILFYERKV